VHRIYLHKQSTIMSSAPISEIYPRYSFQRSTKNGSIISQMTIEMKHSTCETAWTFKRLAPRHSHHRPSDTLRVRHQSAVDEFCAELNTENIPRFTAHAELNSKIALTARDFVYRHDNWPCPKKSRIWANDIHFEDRTNSYHFDVEIGDISRLGEALAYFPMPE